jgi:alkyl hydroperoxide reductase subunit F
LDKEHDNSKELKLDGIFIAVGYIPMSKLARSLGIKINDNEEIIINHKTGETSLAGAYAAGDVVDSPFKQVIGAADGGCKAAFSAYDYISKMKK